MTADQLRECREAFMEWFRTTSPQTLDFTLQSTIREFAYQAWKDATIKANTRPTAVASHTEGEVLAWMVDDPEERISGFVTLDDFDGKEDHFTAFLKTIKAKPIYTHPPRSVDEAMVVKLGRELFRFNSFEQWVNKAKSWFKTAGVSSTQFVCIDATGHICGMGKQFMSARDRNAFPVIVYHIEPEKDAAMASRGGS